MARPLPATSSFPAYGENRAPLWPRPFIGGGAGFAGPGGAENESRQKNQKSSKSLLTPDGLPAYIRLTNDGGHAADDKELRSNSRELDEIKESRVSDTRPG